MARTRPTGMSALTTASGGKANRLLTSNPSGFDLNGPLVGDRAMEAWYHLSIACMTPQPEGHMASYIERRKFLATFGGAAAWPLAASAQQGQRARLVCILEGISADRPGAKRRYAAFLEGLQQLGW